VIPHWPRRARRGAALLALALVAAGCGKAEPRPEPVASLVVLADWVTFTSGPGDFRVTLPPWLIGPRSPDIPADESVLFASEPLAPGESAASTVRIQMRVNGSGSIGPPPEGEDPSVFLRWMHESETSGVPVVTRALLPAGPAARLEQVNLRGTPNASHVLAFLIETPFGLAYLQFDGYEFAWHGRAEDIELIAQSVRFR
jgi:hypothetical protein